MPVFPLPVSLDSQRMAKPPGVQYLGCVPEPWIPGLFRWCDGFRLFFAMRKFWAPEFIDPLNTDELAAALAKLFTSRGLRIQNSPSQAGSGSNSTVRTAAHSNHAIF